MFGYVPLYCKDDICTQWAQRTDAVYLANVLTVVWAAAYFFDAILYFLALLVHNPDNRGRFVYWSAELGNLASSVVYVLSQLCYFHPDFANTDNLAIFARICIVQASLYLGSLILWMINSFQYLAVWYSNRQADSRPKRFFLADIGFWAELFNIWPSMGYVGTACWGLIVLFPEWTRAQNSNNDLTGFQSFYYANQSVQLIINLAWDLAYCIDSILYMAMWGRDSAHYSGAGAAAGDKYVKLDDDKKESLLDKGTYY